MHNATPVPRFYVRGFPEFLSSNEIWFKQLCPLKHFVAHRVAPRSHLRRRAVTIARPPSLLSLARRASERCSPARNFVPTVARKAIAVKRPPASRGSVLDVKSHSKASRSAPPICWNAVAAKGSG